MLEDIQKITDRLAADLNRSVFTEDGWFRPLGTSAQLGTVDDPRVQALLYREPADEHVRYFRDCGVTTTVTPIRVPASTEHGLLPRLMIPVTTGPRVLARVWLIDADPPIDDHEMSRALHACREMRAHLVERRQTIRRDVAAGSRLLHELQHAGEKHRRTLVQQLRDAHGIGQLERSHACVVTMTPRPDEATGYGAASGERTVVNSVLDTFIEQLDTNGAIGYARDDALIALVGTCESGLSTLETVSFAAHRAVAPHGDVLRLDTIGLGGPLETADGFNVSVGQAQFAARVAGAVPAMAGMAQWETLHEYRLFYPIEWSRAGVASIDPGVAKLVDEKRTPLAATLLAYLEREGDVDATAAELNVHRTTLYYRIERAKHVLGSEPTGPARFRIHAALRLARLADLYSAAVRTSIGA